MSDEQPNDPAPKPRPRPATDTARSDILADEAGGFPRTVGREGGPCECQAKFGFEVALKGTVLAQGLLSATGGEITVRGSQQIGIQVKVVKVGTMPGTLSFAFTRDAPNTTDPTAGPFPAASEADLKAILAAAKYVPMAAPPGLDKDHTPIVETVTATATWTPQGQNGCPLAETLRIVWQYAVNPNDNTPPDYASAVSKSGSATGVAVGQTLAQPPNAPTQHYTAPLRVYYKVDKPNECCGAQRGYAVVQFVSHSWKLDEPQVRKGTSDWALDVIDSQVQAADQHQPYDPTYTHDPLGANPAEPPIVYPGPNAGGGAAIVQIDAPGLPPALYARFAKAGGTFSWRYYSFLVCQLSPSNAATYLQNGTVTQSLCYQIDATFPGGDRAPAVSGTIRRGPTTYPCRNLKSVLEAVDKNDDLARKQLLHAYQHPAAHQVAI